MFHQPKMFSTNIGREFVIEHNIHLMNHSIVGYSNSEVRDCDLVCLRAASSVSFSAAIAYRLSQGPPLPRCGLHFQSSPFLPLNLWRRCSTIQLQQGCPQEEFLNRMRNGCAHHSQLIFLSHSRELSNRSRSMRWYLVCCLQSQKDFRVRRFYSFNV